MPGHSHKKARYSVLEVLDDHLDELDITQSVSDVPDEGSSDSDQQSGNEDDDDDGNDNEGPSQVKTDGPTHGGENIISIPSPPLTVTKK
jgi:hypothetical protein